jgi:hypothetical protein
VGNGRRPLPVPNRAGPRRGPEFDSAPWGLWGPLEPRTGGEVVGSTFNVEQCAETPRTESFRYCDLIEPLLKLTHCSARSRHVPIAYRRDLKSYWRGCVVVKEINADPGSPSRPVEAPISR